MKRLKIKNLIILLVILILLHLVVGFIASPALTSLAVKTINEKTAAKISLEKMHLWPLTLTIELKNLKVFDPDQPQIRIVAINNMKASLSFFGLLSRRIMFNGVSIDSLEINTQGSPDGTFNIEKIGRKESTPEKKQTSDLGNILREKKDWFSKLYEIIKQRFSKKQLAKAKVERKDAAKTVTEVIKIPHGRRVIFRPLTGEYLFGIKKLRISDANIIVSLDDGNTVAITEAHILLNKLFFDSQNNLRLERCRLSGKISANQRLAGTIELDYLTKLNQDTVQTQYLLNAEDVDLDAIRFVYRDSLPVNIEKGTLQLESKTILTDDALDSKNNLTLANHKFSVQETGTVADMFMPLPILCETLNDITPLTLQFAITGTLEKPEFKGFQEALAQLTKPALKTIQKRIEKQGMDILRKVIEKNIKSPSSEDGSAPTNDTTAQKAIDAINAIFGTKEEKK